MNVETLLNVLLLAVVSGRQSQVNKIVTEGVEESSFSCHGRITGYYADVETGCRTYHYCNGGNQYSYACPNNTLFQQRIFICNHWYLVDCSSSERHYSANLLIGQRDRAFIGEDYAEEVTPAGETEGTAYATEREPKATTYEYGDEIRKVEEDGARHATIKAANRTGKSDFNGGNDLVSTERDEGFVKLRFSDRRELFYIPNGNDSRPGTPPTYREFLIPRSGGEADVMRFKSRIAGPGEVICPNRCDRRFIRPNTCHPCIVIK